jgi:hypothetical protein
MQLNSKQKAGAEAHLCELPELIFVGMRQQRQQRHFGPLDNMRCLAMSNLPPIN